MNSPKDVSEQTTERSPGQIEIRFAGERLVLTPERAAWWPAGETVFIADPHFGKAATFRAAAIPIPDATHEDLGALDRLMDRTGAAKLIVLGDLIHARRGRCETTFAAIDAWRRTHPDLRIQLVRGNHDVRAGRPPAAWRMEELDDGAAVGPFTLSHYPDPRGRPTLAGHLHPKIRLDLGADRVQLPCFLQRQEVLILPAFTRFADHGLIRREPGDEIYAVTDEAVFRL